MDSINIVDLEVFANHGVLPEENILGQKFSVSATLYFDMRAACESDSVNDTVNYAKACEVINTAMRESTCNLIERAASETIDALLREFPRIERVRVEVKKPWAPIGYPLAYASVAIERTRAERL